MDFDFLKGEIINDWSNHSFQSLIRVGDNHRYRDITWINTITF